MDFINFIVYLSGFASIVLIGKLIIDAINGNNPFK